MKRILRDPYFESLVFAFGALAWIGSVGWLPWALVEQEGAIVLIAAGPLVAGLIGALSLVLFLDRSSK